MNDREQLEILRHALNAAYKTLRHDEYGTYRINGSRGHIYADGTGWLLFVACRSARHWTATKRRLADCYRVTQDSDDEGCLHLASLPDPDQAAIIRDILGLRQTREVPADRALVFQRAQIGG